MGSCVLCPRACKADRAAGKPGVCGMTEELMVARAALHYWEEPCISGEEGSGTVFFSGCALHCVYCQNYEIAAGRKGKRITKKELSSIFLDLQEQGANNINLVTPSHYVPQIKEALLDAKQNGLALPVVYNTSSYETADTLRQMEGLVDIYLADLKYKSSALSKKYSAAADYFLSAAAALAEMARQIGVPEFYVRLGGGTVKTAAEYEDGMLMKRGVIVRHLMLPGCLEDSKQVIRYLYETYGSRIYISIMNQYTPLPHAAAYPELNRKITEEEYEELVDYAIGLGVEHGFIQEGETADESFIPAFAEGSK